MVGGREKRREAEEGKGRGERGRREGRGKGEGGGRVGKDRT